MGRSIYCKVRGILSNAAAFPSSVPTGRSCQALYTAFIVGAYYVTAYILKSIISYYHMTYGHASEQLLIRLCSIFASIIAFMTLQC